MGFLFWVWIGAVTPFRPRMSCLNERMSRIEGRVTQFFLRMFRFAGRMSRIEQRVPLYISLSQNKKDWILLQPSQLNISNYTNEHHRTTA